MKLNPLHSNISVLILLTVPCKLNGTSKVNLFNGAPLLGVISFHCMTLKQLAASHSKGSKSLRLVHLLT